MSQPFMNLYNSYPFSTRGLTLFSGDSTNTPSNTHSYYFDIKIPIQQSNVYIPLNGADPSINTKFEVFITDSNNIPIIDNQPCWSFDFPFANQYMTWNTATSMLEFKFQTDAQNPVSNANIIENFYILPWTSHHTLVGPYNYYFVFTFTNSYVLGSGLTNSVIVTNATGNVYTFALCSEYDGAKTNVIIGNNREPLLTFASSDNTIKYGSDTILTSANLSNFPMIPGLQLDPVTKLLEFNNCQVMVNQYVKAGIPMNMTSAITGINYPLNTNQTLVGYGTITGTFGDLFNDVNNYSFNCSMPTTNSSSQYPPYSSGDPTSSTTMNIIIYDASGTSISLNPSYANQPAFVFVNTGFSFVSGNLIFNMNISPQSTPAGNDKYFFYSMPLNTSAIGPFTIKYFIMSYYSGGGGTASFGTVNSMNSCTFTNNEADFTNPCPVVSNTNSSGVVTIRTAPTGPAIQWVPSGQFNVNTQSLNIIPIGSTTPKVYNGVITGNYSTNLNNLTPLVVNLPLIPNVQYSYNWTWFIYYSPLLFLTYNASGVADPTRSAIYGQTSNIVNHYGAVLNTMTSSLSASVLSLTMTPLIPTFTWTLSYDIISL